MTTTPKLISELSDTSFESDVLQARGAVLVDFWAPWCSTCRAMDPVLEQLARQYEGRVRFARLNVDEYPDLADRYDIRSLPTLLFFQNGTLAGRAVGYVEKSVLAEHLEAIARTS